MQTQKFINLCKRDLPLMGFFRVSVISNHEKNCLDFKALNIRDVISAVENLADVEGFTSIELRAIDYNNDIYTIEEILNGETVNFDLIGYILL